MRVLLAPNCLRGCLAAGDVAGALERGVRAAAPGATVWSEPAADGGDGSLDYWLRTRDEARLRTTTVRGPLGDTVRARWGLHGETAFVEMAEASGLRTLVGRRADPLSATTYGTGELIAAALDAGARHLLIGAGGSATLDLGAGALAALGVRFLDADGAELAPRPGVLHRLDRVDLTGVHPGLARARLEVLSDVRTPLRLNVVRYGEQKGIAPSAVPQFSAMLRCVAEVLRPDRPELLESPWYGAGGGLPAGLSAVGAEASAGAAALLSAGAVPALLPRADLVITAEGRVDRGSLEGKLPLTIAALAAEHGVPCTVLTADARVHAADLPPGTTCRVLRGDISVDRPRATADALASAARSAVAARAALI